MFIKKNPDTIDHVPSEFLFAFQGLSQTDIPTGCESVSTTAVLQYYGIDISIDTFIEKYLPCDTFYWKDKKLHGPNPHDFFVGNPYTRNSLGCYPEVILKALDKMKNKDHSGMSELDFKETTGIGLDDLTRNCIPNKIPVIVWVTINMKAPYDGMQYYLEDETLYTWKAQEHCIVLCGYDEEHYYLMDPMKDGKIVVFPKDVVKKRYNEMGRNSIVIYPCVASIK